MRNVSLNVVEGKVLDLSGTSLSEIWVNPTFQNKNTLMSSGYAHQVKFLDETIFTGFTNRPRLTYLSGLSVFLSTRTKVTALTHLSICHMLAATRQFWFRTCNGPKHHVVFSQGLGALDFSNPIAYTYEGNSGTILIIFTDKTSPQARFFERSLNHETHAS